MHSHWRVNAHSHVRAIVRTCECMKTDCAGSAGDLAEVLSTPFAKAQVDLEAVLRVFGDNRIHHVAFARNLSLDWLRASLGDRIATVVWSALHPPVGAESAPMRHSHRRSDCTRTRTRVDYTPALVFYRSLALRASKAIASVGFGTNGRTDARMSNVRRRFSRADCASIAPATVYGSNCCGLRHARTHAHTHARTHAHTHARTPHAHRTPFRQMPPPFEPCQDLHDYLKSISGEHLFSECTKRCINMKLLHKMSAKQLGDAGFASGVVDILMNARNHSGGGSGSMVRVRVCVHSCVSERARCVPNHRP